MQVLAYRCDGAEHVERAGITLGTTDDIELRDTLHVSCSESDLTDTVRSD